MKIAVIGSRNLYADVSKYIPEEVSCIISGGAKGIDSAAEEYADRHNIPKLIIRPDYEKYGKHAPLIRNEAIVDAADMVIAVWDGKSRGTKHAVNYAKAAGKAVEVHLLAE